MGRGELSLSKAKSVESFRASVSFQCGASAPSRRGLGLGDDRESKAVFRVESSCVVVWIGITGIVVMLVVVLVVVGVWWWWWC